MFTYLLLNIFTLLIPLLFSFEKKVEFFRHWKFVLPAIVISAICFLALDSAFTAMGVWSFNPRYLLGLYAGNLPIEEVFFFVSVPYASMFLYVLVRELLVQPRATAGVQVLFFTAAILLLLSAIFSHGKIYTVTTSVGMAVLLFLLCFLRVKFLAVYFFTWLLQLIPFVIINGILTGLPVVQYNNQDNMAIRFFTIPIEDFLYCALLLLMTVSWYEFFRGNRQLNFTKTTT